MGLMTLDTDEIRAHLGDWHHEHRVLYEGLADALEDLIRRGVLPPDTRLPAERRLADTLHLSRSTVKAAYEALRDRGLVATRHGSGSIILTKGSPLTGPREAQVVAAFQPNSIYEGMLRLEADAIDLRGAAWHGTDLVDEDVLAAAHEGLAKLPAAHGYFPLGIPAAREAIADHLTRTGLPTTADQVMVTTGAQQGISLAADMLLAAGDTVAVEELSFPAAMNYASSRQARLLPVPLSAGSVDVSALDRLVRAARPRMTYLMTSVHNPTGAVLPGPARFRLAELSRDWDTVLVDDRALADTQLDGEVATPLAALVDEHGNPDRLLTLGSMSKVTWAGLRIGWIRSTPSMIDRLSRIKTLTDFGTPVLDQLVAVELLADPEQLPRRRDALRERRDAFRAALAAAVPDWDVPTPLGGLVLWTGLDGVDSHAFSEVAARHGVGLAPGSVSSPTRAAADHVRLPYGRPIPELEEAAVRLGQAWQEIGDRRERRPFDPACVVV